MIRLFFSICFLLIYAAGNSQTASVSIKVIGVTEVKGNMNIAIFNNAEDFSSKENCVVGKEIPVVSKSFEYSFGDIPIGTYAIAIFHDLDNNRELNTNWIGMPKEPFGFSNNAKVKMGPPDYEDAAFEIPHDVEIIINLIEL